MTRTPNRDAFPPTKRALIVNCYFDEGRRGSRRTTKLPQPVGPVFLAGAFSPRCCEVRVHNEMSSGPLEDPNLLSGLDMLVLTGLTTSLDRMLHLTAYCRTLSPQAAVVAGGPAIRVLPRFAQRVFDYPCQGDVEQLSEVIADAFGQDYAAEEVIPRYDLASWIRGVGYVESSRNCNFRCAFCSLTAERRDYLRYGLDQVERQIAALGRKPITIFVDNNFYGNNQDFFLARIDLIRHLQAAGKLGAWAAVVSEDFFLGEENLRLVTDSGCFALFCGLESFDVAWLRRMRKAQNTRLSQLEILRRCREAGVLLLYGLMLDVTSRRISEIGEELSAIAANPEIPLPSYVTAPIPMLGTPFFHKCLAEGMILPDTKVRDLDGTTLSLRPIDPIPEVAAFLQKIQSFGGYRVSALLQAAKFLLSHRDNPGSRPLVRSLGKIIQLWTQEAISTRLFAGVSKSINPRRTFVSTTEPQDRVYTPAFPVDGRFESYFRPTKVTDGSGRITDELAADLLACESARLV